MSDIADLRNASFEAVSNYLNACDWGETCGDQTILYRVDPITGQAHRSDFAWFIQTERDSQKLNDESYKKMNGSTIYILNEGK